MPSPAVRLMSSRSWASHRASVSRSSIFSELPLQVRFFCCRPATSAVVPLGILNHKGETVSSRARRRSIVAVLRVIPRECPASSLPSRREGRAPPGHGRGHGRRPSAPDAGTPERRRAARAPPAPGSPARRSRPPRPPPGRGTENLESWQPGSPRRPGRISGFQIPSLPTRAPGDRRCGVAPRSKALSRQPLLTARSHRVGR